MSESPKRVRWRAEASDVLTAHFHAIERGGGWLRIAGHEPLALAGGDLVVVPRGTGHTLTDSLGSRARPLAEMVPARADAGCAVMRGGGEGAETRFVCGSFRFERRDTHPLVELLPAVIHLRPAETPAAEWLTATLRFLAWETREARPGTETIVSRLTDVIFVQMLRAWLESLPEGRGGWLGALRDRQIGAALAHVHRAPERPWTNAALAAAVGMSRSRFAARFSALVGEPPVAYLSRWRLETAAAGSWRALSRCGSTRTGCSQRGQGPARSRTALSTLCPRDRPWLIGQNHWLGTGFAPDCGRQRPARGRGSPLRQAEGAHDGRRFVVVRGVAVGTSDMVPADGAKVASEPLRKGLPGRPDAKIAAVMETTGDADRKRAVRHLRQLIDALNRRVPHIERVGEAKIARDAAELMEKALQRLKELEEAD